MTLDNQELKDGLKRIVGTWKAEYLVNGLSDDLAHIPASEFKSEDGRSFSDLTFRFFEDHTLDATASPDGVWEKGTWEQTGMFDYRYHLDRYDEIPEGPFRDAAETLSFQDGRLVFAIGFLAVALMKTEEGTVTEEPKEDIGDIEQTEEEKSHKEIAGKYRVFRTMGMVGDNFGLFTREEVEADLDARGADEEERNDALQMFDVEIEITEDGQIIQWMPLPAGVTQEQIDEAIREGEIEEVRDGRFPAGRHEWKYVRGSFWYNTEQQREVFGEEMSPWDELKVDAEGNLPFGSGMMVLRRV